MSPHMMTWPQRRQMLLAAASYAIARQQYFAQLAIVASLQYAQVRWDAVATEHLHGLQWATWLQRWLVCQTETL